MSGIMSWMIAIMFACFTIGCGESNTSGACEEFLTEYEEFADEYIAYMRKMKSNPSDISVLTASASMMEKAAKFSERADDEVCKGNSEAVKRVQKVQEKVAKAMQ